MPDTVSGCDIDLQLDEQADGSFLVVSPNNHLLAMPDERSACELQRHWRTLHGLDPMTGDYVS